MKLRISLLRAVLVEGSRVKAVVLLDEKEIGDKAVETALKECVNTLVNTVKFYILVTA